MSILKVNTIQNTSAAHSSTPEEIAQGRAKAWVNYNGTGTIAIRDSFNVSSITDVSTGTTTVTMATAMSNANYVLATAAGNTSTDGFRVLGCFNNFTTTTFTLVSSFQDASPYVFDGEINTVAVFGD
tara:strand:- start:2280 stop:2660 length:381 start_codon:yes stop_codon:yes gene_type:complete